MSGRRFLYQDQIRRNDDLGSEQGQSTPLLAPREGRISSADQGLAGSSGLLAPPVSSPECRWPGDLLNSVSDHCSETDGVRHQGADPTGKGVQRRRSVQIETVAIVSADLMALVGATIFGLVALAPVTGTRANSLSRLSQNLRIDLIFPVVALIVFAAYGLYRQRRRRFRPRGFHDVGLFFHAVSASALATLGVGVLIHRVSGYREVTPGQLFAIALCALLLVPLSRGGANLVLWKYSKIRIRVLIVGTGVIAEQVRQHCAEDPGVEVVGMVDDNPSLGFNTLGSIADIAKICENHEIDRVIVTFSRSHPSETVKRLRELHGSVPISLVPRYFEVMSYRSQIDEIDGLPMVDIAPNLFGPMVLFIKRSLDIIGSIIGLLLLAPVLFVACITIKCSSKGPVFFGQVRVGRKGKAFRTWKLRTMHIGAETVHSSLAAEENGGTKLLKLQNDPRVFSVVRFLRRFSIDEIPQLFNVLCGEMSLVGPRPFIPEESDLFENWACRRYEMRPGITGLWQVSGRSDLSHDELQRLDYLYVASWSILWDLRILWKTPGIVLRARGAY